MSAENLPLVTVICNCHNHELYVSEALESVTNQTYTNIELIVVNNGSDDKSAEIIQNFAKKHPSVIFINLPKSLSMNSVFNLAVKKSSGEFLIDLSGDDRLLPDCITKQVEFFAKQNENVGLIFGNALIINEKGELKDFYFSVDNDQKVLDKNLFETTYKRLLAGGLCMCSISAMIRRKHFEILNGYDENLFFEDLDYWLRLSYQYQIAFLDEILVEKREISSSLGSQFYKKNDFAKKINASLQIIYKEAMKRNNKPENKCLLKRIHFSMQKSFENSNLPDLFKFSVLEMRCRIHLGLKIWE